MVKLNRRGPFKVWPSGKYVGNLIDATIREDPAYFMYTVKAWLDISPEQAELFQFVTDGGEIPLKYIKKGSPTKVTNTSKEDYDPPEGWTIEDIQLVKNTWNPIPNYDFDPEMAPDWWPECKKKMDKEKRPTKRREIYESYLRKEVQDYMG